MKKCRALSVGVMFAFLLLLCAIRAVAETEKELEASLKHALIGKFTSLKIPYTADRLKFDQDGRLAGRSEIGPWTTYGIIAIRAIELKGPLLKFKAERVITVLKEADNGTKLVPLGAERALDIAISLPQGFDSDTVKKTLSTILQGGDIDEHLKSAWIAYADSGDNKNIIERTHPKGIIGVLEGDRVVYSAPNLMAPKAIYTRDPEYPEDAMSKRIEGTVVLGIIINEKGYPEILQVLRPLKDDLDVSALAAVATWRFHPATKDGVPVATKVSVEVSFRAR